MIGNGFIFQYHNDPKHTANASEIWREKTLTVMEMPWPPQSPNLNIIEVVWDHLDRERNKRQPKEEQWEVLKEAEYNTRRLLKKTSRQVSRSGQRVQDVQREVTLNTDFFL